MNDLASATDGWPNHHAQIRRNRLRFRCWHRGTQEIVPILGVF